MFSWRIERFEIFFMFTLAMEIVKNISEISEPCTEFMR